MVDAGFFSKQMVVLEYLCHCLACYFRVGALAHFACRSAVRLLFLNVAYDSNETSGKDQTFSAVPSCDILQILRNIVPPHSPLNTPAYPQSLPSRPLFPPPILRLAIWTREQKIGAKLIVDRCFRNPALEIKKLYCL